MVWFASVLARVWSASRAISDGFCSKNPRFSTDRVSSKDERWKVISGKKDEHAVHRIRRFCFTADQNVSRFVPFWLGSVCQSFLGRRRSPFPAKAFAVAQWQNEILWNVLITGIAFNKFEFSDVCVFLIRCREWRAGETREKTVLFIFLRKFFSIHQQKTIPAN